jgi:protein tyrosine phosphatase
MRDILKDTRCAKEFDLLDELFPWGRTKKTMNKFQHLNIYSDVFPFIETQIFIRQGSQTRDQIIANVQEQNYINASYIKSAFGECHPNK